MEDRVQSVRYERLWGQGDEGVLTQGEERSWSLGGETVPSLGEERSQSLVGERSERLGGERVLSPGEERSSLGDERVPSLREERVQSLLDESVCSQMEERSPNQVEQRRFHKLSVAAEDIELSTVPKATAQGIWGKASRLLNTPGSISKAPGNDSAFMVASQTLKKPHFVQVSANGNVCDEFCPMWRGRKLCAHTVAVAEKAQALPQFVHWLRKSNRECNLTMLVTTSKEKRSAGTKAGKPNRRSGSFRQTTLITAYRSSIDDVCTASSEHMDAPSKDLGPARAFLWTPVTQVLRCKFQTPCINPVLIGTHHLLTPTPTIPLLISTHMVSHCHMVTILTVNRTVHFLLTPHQYRLSHHHRTLGVWKFTNPSSMC